MNPIFASSLPPYAGLLVMLFAFMAIVIVIVVLTLRYNKRSGRQTYADRKREARAARAEKDTARVRPSADESKAGRSAASRNTGASGNADRKNDFGKNRSATKKKKKH